MLANLESVIASMINAYLKNQDDELLIKIFVTIQLWGGNAGRGIFIRNGGLETNYSAEIYQGAIELVQKGNYAEANRLLIQIPYLGTAFSTKHIHFWSDSKAPIFDSVMAKIVFGRKTATPGKYLQYIESIGTLSHMKKVNASIIERNLFNWANTPEGRLWICMRFTSK